jgi:hypothetical protein
MDNEDNIPTYQHYEAMLAIRKAAESLAKEDEHVIYRDAFRWKDHYTDAVIPNHYEMHDIHVLAKEFEFEIVHDFHHVAVIRSAPIKDSQHG